jgi:hypothetical protein
VGFTLISLAVWCVVPISEFFFVALGSTSPVFGPASFANQVSSQSSRVFHRVSEHQKFFSASLSRLLVCLSQPGARAGLRCCEHAARCPFFVLRWSSHLRAQKHTARALDSPPPWVKKCFSRASLKIDWLLLQYAVPSSSFTILLPLTRGSIWFTLILLCAAWKRDHSCCGFSHLALLGVRSRACTTVEHPGPV